MFADKTNIGARAQASWGVEPVSTSAPVRAEMSSPTTPGALVGSVEPGDDASAGCGCGAGADCALNTGVCPAVCVATSCGGVDSMSEAELLIDGLLS